MFYTIASRLIKTNSPKNNLYIFLVGSICYVIIHWQLHLKTQVGIAEKIRNYLYYVMIADIGMAYALTHFYPKKPVLTNETEDKQIAENIEEVRKMQQQRQREIQEQKKTNTIENKPDETADKNINKTAEKQETPETPENPENNEKESSETQTPEDTDIPKFTP